MSLIIVPQEMTGGCRPRAQEGQGGLGADVPRQGDGRDHNQRGQWLGTTCLRMILLVAPKAGRRSQKSALRTWITDERMMRVLEVQPRIPNARDHPPTPCTGWRCPWKRAQHQDATEQQGIPRRYQSPRKDQSTQPPKARGNPDAQPPTNAHGEGGSQKHRPGLMPWPRK